MHSCYWQVYQEATWNLKKTEALVFSKVNFWFLNLFTLKTNSRNDKGLKNYKKEVEAGEIFFLKKGVKNVDNCISRNLFSLVFTRILFVYFTL